MPPLKPLAIVAALGSLSAGVAVAKSQSSETTPVTADFQAALVSQTQRPCDDTHLTFALRFEGTLASSDPRLAGDLVVQARLVAESQTGYGTTTAHVAIRDHATGAPKFDGTYLGVLARGRQRRRPGRPHDREALRPRSWPTRTSIRTRTRGRSPASSARTARPRRRRIPRCSPTPVTTGVTADGPRQAKAPDGRSAATEGRR
jgi:hypothetical protein